MKHPVIVGATVGAVGILLWIKRATVRAFFTRMRHPLSGAETPPIDPAALVNQMLAKRSPVLLVVASGYDTPRIQALLEQFKRSRGAMPDSAPVFDAESWPSTVPTSRDN